MTQETRRIGDIVIGERFRRNMGDLKGLARSIAEVGLLHPIVITPDNRLIAGGRRLAACALLGWTEVPVTVISLSAIVRGEYAENMERKAFLPTEMVAIAKALEPEMAAPIGRPPREQRQQSLLTSAPASSGAQQTRDKVAAYVGVAGWTLQKAEAVVEAAEREPERFGPLVEQMDRTGKVHGAYKQLKRIEQAEAINAEPPPLPTGPFRVIVADPPWAYDKRPDDLTNRAIVPYPNMTLEEITALPVPGMAAPDCVLWLWTTNAHLPDSFAVLAAWGFQHKTVLTWVKDRMGMGDWLRGQTEHCLMAVRGRPTVLLTNQTTVLHAPVQEHSRKPEAFFEMVEAMCPGSKVELFSRRQRSGWAAFGDQATHSA